MGGPRELKLGAASDWVETCVHKCWESLIPCPRKAAVFSWLQKELESMIIDQVAKQSVELRS